MDLKEISDSCDVEIYAAAIIPPPGASSAGRDERQHKPNCIPLIRVDKRKLINVMPQVQPGDEVYVKVRDHVYALNYGECSDV